jgi:hypothetical protein
MKTFNALIFSLLLGSSSAFTFATRAVGAKAPVKAAPAKVVAKAAPVKAAPVKAAPVKAAPVVKKVVAKAAPAKVVAKAAPVKAAPVKVVAKAAPVKVVAKAAPAKAAAKAAPAKAAPAKAAPVKKVGAKAPKFSFSFKAPKVAKPSFSVKLPSTKNVKKNIAFAYDDGLTDLERKQRKTIPTFLTGSAKSQADPSTIRTDLSSVGTQYSFSPFDTAVISFVSFWALCFIIKAGSQ